MAASFGRRFQSGLTASVGTQAVLTLVSMGYASGLFGGRSQLLGSDDSKQSPADEVFDAPHYDLVTAFVTSLYSGRGARHAHVRLTDGVTFEDPAVICRGAPEVHEAFRALTRLDPQSLTPPRCVDVEPLGESISLTYALHQRYLGWLELQSLLVVQVQLQQMRDFPESEFRVVRIEEHWNGVPPLSTYLFWIVRRINGVASAQLTSRLLLATKDEGRN